MPEIGRLTAAGQLTQFPAPVQPGLSFTLPEQPEQIIAGPENDLWFIANGSGANVLARITPTGALSQFPAPLVRNGRGEIESKHDEVPQALAKAADGNLWMGEEFEEGTIGLVGPGGVVRQFRVAEPGQGVVTSAGDPMIGTADGGLWFRETTGFTLVSPAGVVLSRVRRENEPAGFVRSLVTTPDGVLWVSEDEAGEAYKTVKVLKRVTSAGEFGELVFCSSNETPEGMAVGPEGALWFGARTGKDFGRLDLLQTDERTGTGADAGSDMRCESHATGAACHGGVREPGRIEHLRLPGHGHACGCIQPRGRRRALSRKSAPRTGAIERVAASRGAHSVASAQAAAAAADVVVGCPCGRQQRGRAAILTRARPFGLLDYAGRNGRRSGRICRAGPGGALSVGEPTSDGRVW